MNPLSSESGDIVRSIRRTLRLLVAATVTLWVAVLVIAFLTFSAASTTHDALCTLRADLTKRVAQTEGFLAAHPQPILLGVPRQTFVKSLGDQKRTIKALDLLGC